MGARAGDGRVPERRAARRFSAEHAARLQFVTRIAGVQGLPGADLWPNLICRTCDVGEAGLGLVVPGVREGDEYFFGVDGAVRVTLGLPTGAVEAVGVAARYSREDGGGGRSGFLVGVRITEMGEGKGDKRKGYYF